MKVTINVVEIVKGHFELVGAQAEAVGKILGDNIKVEGRWDFAAVKAAQRMAEAKAKAAGAYMVSKWTQG